MQQVTELSIQFESCKKNVHSLKQYTFPFFINEKIKKILKVLNIYCQKYLLCLIVKNKKTK